MKKLNFRDLCYFITGICFLTLGIRIIGLSDLGLAFSDAIIIKLAELFNFSITIFSLIVGMCVLILSSIVTKTRFKFECLITSFLLGFFIDFWMFLIPNIIIYNFFIKIIVFLIGAFILSVGVSIYLQPQYPPHPNDFLLINLVKRFNISVLKSKICVDAIFAIFAILLSAPIGIGSVFNTFCLGLFIDKTFGYIEKLYKKNNQ